MVPISVPSGSVSGLPTRARYSPAPVIASTWVNSAVLWGVFMISGPLRSQ